MSLSDAYQSVQKSLNELLVPSLKWLHGPIDSFLTSLSLTTAKFTTIAVFVVAGVWVLSLPKKFVYLGAPDEARWRDLRVWAIVVLIPYILVYWWLG